MTTQAVMERTLGDLVTDRPTRARVLERLGLDYCCNGTRTLAAACQAAGLDVATVAAELDTGTDAGADDGWTRLSAPELADDIVATHHRYLREELPLLVALAAKVLAAHGGRHPELDEVRGLVIDLRAALEPHLDKEERVLFPAIHALFAGGRELPFGSVATQIAVMTAEHDRAAELLAALRQAADGYRVPSDACASYRSLYERLAALEHDTHVHVHKENHRLFPAAVAMETGA
jgi:regulator of cell morphogenesis and NO signaling